MLCYFFSFPFLNIFYRKNIVYITCSDFVIFFLDLINFILNVRKNFLNCLT